MKKIFITTLILVLILSGCKQKIVHNKTSTDEIIIEGFGTIKITNLNKISLSNKDMDTTYDILTYDLNIIQETPENKIKKIYYENNDSKKVSLDTINDSFDKMKDSFVLKDDIEFKDLYNTDKSKGSIYHVFTKPDYLNDFYKNFDLIIETDVDKIKINIDLNNVKYLVEKNVSSNIDLDDLGNIQINNLSYYYLTSYSNKYKPYEIVGYDINLSNLKEKVVDIYYEDENNRTTLETIKKTYDKNKEHLYLFNSKLIFNDYFNINEGIGSIYHIIEKNNDIMNFYNNNKLIIETENKKIKIDLDIENAEKYDDKDLTYTFPHTFEVEGLFELRLDYSDEFISNKYVSNYNKPELQGNGHYFKSEYIYDTRFSTKYQHYEFKSILNSGQVLGTGINRYYINENWIDGSNLSYEHTLFKLGTGFPMEAIDGIVVIIKDGDNRINHLFLLDD